MGKGNMWNTGFCSKNGLYYWTLRCGPILASRLYSTLSSDYGPVSETQFLNEKVKWLRGDYDFIIFGKEQEKVNAIKKCVENLLQS